MIAMIVAAFVMLGTGLMALGVAIWIWQDSRHDRDVFAYFAVVSMFLLSLLPLAFAIQVVADLI